MESYENENGQFTVMKQQNINDFEDEIEGLAIGLESHRYWRREIKMNGITMRNCPISSVYGAQPHTLPPAHINNNWPPLRLSILSWKCTRVEECVQRQIPQLFEIVCRYQLSLK